MHGTVLHGWYREHALERGLNASRHLNVILSDVVRMALLYKIGGAYLDLDMISIAPLPAHALEHSVGQQLILLVVAQHLLLPVSTAVDAVLQFVCCCCAAAVVVRRVLNQLLWSPVSDLSLYCPR